MAQYMVPESNIGWLREKVDKLNKRAEKLGVEPVRMMVVRESVRKLSDYEAIKVFTVEVEGTAPVLAGWKFIGTIQHVKDNGESATVLRAVPGYEIGEYRDADPQWCDQCKMSRVRNDTFVVQNVQPDINMKVDPIRKRIGRQCLKDFMGHPKPEMYADWAEDISLLDSLFRAAEDDIGSGRRNDRVFFTDAVIAVSATVIRKFGWVSGRVAYEAEQQGDYETAEKRTRNVVSQVFMGDVRVDDFRPMKADKTLAQDALAWARGGELKSLAEQQRNSDYLYNLWQVTRLEAIDARMFGIAVSLIPAYERQMSKRSEGAGSTSTHFGTPGVRATFISKVIEKRGITMANGDPITLVKFETPEGDVAAWFTGGTNMALGKTYSVKATVKRHDMYKGVAQTVLGRVTVMGEKLAST